MDQAIEKYKILDKITEDDKTVTYRAEDVVLHREVVFVQLRITASDKEGRDFLLHARNLGQLHHPGILPVYDMGLYDDAYFYCYRPPPGPSLREQLETSQNHHLLIRSRTYRLQLLLSLADTLSYAHSMGVSVGQLTLDSIVLGQHGEVIIVDWSHMRWRHKKSNREIKPVLVKKDLVSLALLGYRLAFIETSDEHVSIVDWDRNARALPVDLQIIFDRAYLERPVPYESVSDFHHDLSRHLEGLPIDLQKGEIVVSVHSFYRRHKRPFHIVAIVIGLGLLAIVASFFKIEDQRERGHSLKNEIAKLQLSVQVLKDERADVDEENQEQSSSLKEMQSAASRLSERIVQVEAEIETHEREVKSLRDKIAAIRSRYLKLQDEQDKKKKQALQYEDYFLNDLDSRFQEIDIALARREPYVGHLIDTFRHLPDEFDQKIVDDYKSSLFKYLKPSGWFEKFLIGPDLSQLHLQREIDLKGEVRFFHRSRDGKVMLLVVGLKDVVFIKSDRPDEPIVLESLPKKVSQLKFSSNPLVLHGLLGVKDAVVLQLNSDMTAITRQLDLSWKKPYRSILPWSSPNVFRVSDRRSHFYETHLPKTIPASKTDFSKLKPKVTILEKREMQKYALSNQGVFAMLAKDKIYFSNFTHINDKEKVLEVDSANNENRLQEIGFLGTSSYFFIQGERSFVIYYVKTGEKKQALTGSRDIHVDYLTSIEWDSEIHSFIYLQHRGDQILFELEDGESVIWNFKTEKISKTPYAFDGEAVLIGEKQMVVLKNDTQIQVFNHQPQAVEAYVKKQGLFDEDDGQGSNRKLPEASDFSYLPLENEIIDSHHPDESDWVLILNGKRQLEIWDLNQGQRILSMRSGKGEELLRVTFSEQLGAPITLDAKGKVRIW